MVLLDPASLPLFGAIAERHRALRLVIDHLAVPGRQE
jgi:hypothetical protein